MFKRLHLFGMLIEAKHVEASCDSIFKGLDMTVIVQPQTHFESMLAAMRAHYKSGARTAFTLHKSDKFTSLYSGPREINKSSINFGAIDETTIKASLASITDNAKSDSRTLVDVQQSSAQVAVNQVQQDKDASSFIAKMHAQRDQAKAQADANIDKAFDAAIKLGKDLPEEQQNFILNTMGAITNTINSLVSELVDAVSNIINKVYDFIKNIISSVEEFFSAAFSRVVNFI